MDKKEIKLQDNIDSEILGITQSLTRLAGLYKNVAAVLIEKNEECLKLEEEVKTLKESKNKKK